MVSRSPCGFVFPDGWGTDEFWNARIIKARASDLCNRLRYSPEIPFDSPRPSGAEGMSMKRISAGVVFWGLKILLS